MHQRCVSSLRYPSAETIKRYVTIYGDAMTGYEVMWVSLTNYEGKPCLDCTIGVNGEAWSEACELAIVIGG